MTVYFPDPSIGRAVVLHFRFLQSVSELKIMAPVSILSSIKVVVTPVLVSPFMIAQLIGAAPR
jgi:hypothetical protein